MSDCLHEDNGAILHLHILHPAEERRQTVSTRILLADDHALYRQNLRAWLENEPDLQGNVYSLGRFF